MATVKNLLDSYVKEGTSFEEFEGAVKEITEITKALPLRGSEVILLSMKDDDSEPDKVKFFYLDDASIDGVNHGERPKEGFIYINRLPRELMEESANSSRLLLVYNKQMYFISKLALSTMTMRSGVGGDTTVNRSNLIRDQHLADGLMAQNQNISFIYREVNTADDGKKLKSPVRKIYAAMGNTFRPVPQTILVDAARLIESEGKMGKMQTKAWHIDQQYTSLYVEFPEMETELSEMYKLPGTFMPGLYLATSDAGTSSVVVRGTYTYNSHYVIIDEVAMKHCGTITPEKILKRVQKEIFNKFRNLPEALETLISRDVIDYTALDLSSESGAAANFDAVAGIYEKVLMDEFKPLIGKKRAGQLLEALKAEIDGTRPYTMYDIADTFMGLCDRMTGVETLERHTVADIQAACGKAPFVLLNFNTKEVGEEEEEEELGLASA